MPSWNIHTAHVEHLLAEHDARQLGISDANAFLFGNYVPDIYLGFMVPEATFRIDYCLTHMAVPNIIPVPNADQFWDDCVFKRRPESDAGVSLVLGAWAHLVADRMYNHRFREFCGSHEVPTGEELRIRKQADFAVFGRSLGITSRVQITPGLLDAAQKFRQYSVLPADVERTVAVADSIVGGIRGRERCDEYQLLSQEWMTDTFAACNDFLASWLAAWVRLESDGKPASADDIRAVTPNLR